MAPGGSARVFTTAIAGNLLQTATGHYYVDLDLASNTADRINVTGTASLTNKIALNIMNPAHAQTGNHQVTLLHADATVTNHAGLTLDFAPSAVMTYSLLYPDANNIVLSYAINFSPTSLTGNEAALGHAIDRIQAAVPSPPGFAPIANALLSVPTAAALGQVYNQMSGEGTSGAQSTAIAAANAFSSTMMDRVISWLGSPASGAGSGDPALAYASENRRDISRAFSAFDPKQDFEPRWQTWFSGLAGHQIVQGDSNDLSAALTQRIAGAAGGFEYHAYRDLMVGFAAGGSRSNFSVRERGTSGTTDGAHFGVYGIARYGAFYAAANLGYTHSKNDTHRTIATGILATEIAEGHFDSDQISGRLEAGWKHDFGRASVTPFAAIQFSHLRQEGYAETSTNTSGGPAVLGLTFAEQRTNSLPTFLGVQLDYRATLHAMTWASYVRVSWMHEFEPTRAVTPSFNVAAGFPFVVEGARAASDAVRIDAGALVGLTSNTALFGNFSGEFSKISQSYTGNGGVRISW